MLKPSVACIFIIPLCVFNCFSLFNYLRCCHHSPVVLLHTYTYTHTHTHTHTQTQVTHSPHEDAGTCWESRDLIVGNGMRANRLSERAAEKWTLISFFPLGCSDPSTASCRAPSHPQPPTLEAGQVSNGARFVLSRPRHPNNQCFLLK